MLLRADGRKSGEIRNISFDINIINWVEGSCMITQGKTKVLCCATVVDGNTPPFTKGGGWITAEYSMLPRSTQMRTPRSISGRAMEIQRIVGRSLRASCNLKELGERTIIVDCDVIQADGGTRCASITGGFVSLFLSVFRLWMDGLILNFPLKRLVAGISVGIVDGESLIDLTYEEDVKAEVDMNIVATSKGEIIEIQGTGEGRAFLKNEVEKLIDMALASIKEINIKQREVLRPYLDEIYKKKKKGVPYQNDFYF